MTVKLKPEDEQLVQKRVQSGAFASPEEVIHRALESLDAEEDWVQENRQGISEKIERGLDQLERSKGLTPEESLNRLDVKKAEWRAKQRRP